MLLLLFALLSCLIVIHAAPPSLAITMMCRDEDVNLKTNLALWAPFADYYVFLIDSRTIDKSRETIKRVMEAGKKKYKMVEYTFEGFGAARTLSLEETWRTFPEASHVLLADPDWVPDASTINMEELETDADVYRFVVFDRNGITRRKMDWLLKHKQGLAMKYHLHEVLDIGFYSRVASISWVLHEIEKPGSWHATVGHGNSLSLKRYYFDLTMLQKDLEKYGHDPHTDYYLGITNNAVATLLYEQGESPGQYLTDAVHYLTRRVEQQYSAEFTDERWACLYLLGALYSGMLSDNTKATYYLTMCRDFNPEQLECGVALARRYIALGMLDAATKEVEAMLRQELREREYLSHFKVTQCELPQLVAVILGHRAAANALTANDAKLLLLMIHMTQDKMCETHEALTSQSRLVVGALLRGDKSRKLTDPVLTADSPVQALCADSGLQTHLLGNKYVNHPCAEFRQQLALSLQCSMFAFNLPPANEEVQSSTEAKEFVGAALVPDIVHHVYRGDSKRVFSSGHLYRLLFARFNPKIVYNLVGFFTRTGFTAYEMVVVGEEALLAEMKATLEACGPGRRNIVYSSLPLKDYLSGAVEAARVKRGAALFDYVEYTYGISVSEAHEAELASLRQLLTEEGVIGLTYFAQNHHTRRIRQLVETRNTSVQIPFSLQSSRLVKSYLELQGLSALAKDSSLLTFLGAEPVPSHNPYKLDQVAPPANWRGFSQSEVLSLLSRLGLRASAWMPSAYARPFEQLDFHQIKQFWAMGMSQQQFVEEVLTFFRYTLYVQRDAAPPAGAPVLSAALLDDKRLAEQILVIDRMGALSSSFAGLAEKAAMGHSTTFGFAPYSLTGRANMNHVALPYVSPCMPHLSAGHSLWRLHEINEAFRVKHGSNETSASLKLGLVQLLNYLSSVNAISLLREGGPIELPGSAAPPRVTIDVSGSSRPAEVSKPVVPGPPLAVENKESTTSVVKVGGLSFKVKDKSSTGTSTAAVAPKVVEVAKPEPAAPAAKATSSGLDVDTQVQRMKALGFSDAMIKDALAKRAKKTETPAVAEQPSASAVGGLKMSSLRDTNAGPAAAKPAASSSSSGVPPADSEEFKAKLKGILNKYSDKKKAETAEKVPVKEEVVKPAAAAKDSSLAAAAREATTGAADSEEFKQKLKDVLAKYSEKNKKKAAASADETGAGTAKKAAPQTGAAASASASSSSVAGGLLQKRGLDSKKAAAVPQLSKTTPDGVSSKSAAPAMDYAEALRKVKLPAVQTEQQLLSSFRRIECYYKALESGKLPPECATSGPVKRKSSVLGTASPAKLAFDVAQLRYLQRRRLLDASVPVDTLLLEYEKLAAYIANQKAADKNKLTRLAVAPLPVSSTGMVNRVIRVSSADIDDDSLVHLGAVKYLQSMADDVNANDFIVVDVLLKDAALEAISGALLSSTIWFDVTNGHGLVAHHDDGLVLSPLRTLAQYIALAVSTPARMMRVVKYYTVAMSLDRSSTSAVAMASGEEMVAVLWLNGEAPAEAEGDRPVEDGLRIFDDFAAGRLYAQGISVYPSTHSDFFSKSGDLLIDMAAKVNATNSELVPRRSNRLVLLQPRRPFHFVVPPPPTEGAEGGPFEERTSIALVVYLGGA